MKAEQLKVLLNLAKDDYLDLYFADESGFSLTPSISYHWQQKNENVKIKNNAQAEPPKPIGITASDNGLSATIIFDKAIIGNGSKLDIAAIIYNKIKIWC